MNTTENYMLSYRRATARRATSVEILSTTAQLYQKITPEQRPTGGEWPWRSRKVIGIAAIWQPIYHLLLMVDSNKWLWLYYFML